MYRIAKTLNHNSFIGVEEGNNREYLVMGKGIAFGKKTGQRVQPGDDTRIYSLTEMTERGNARTIVQGVSPLSLELASAVLDEAEKEFGQNGGMYRGRIRSRKRILLLVYHSLYSSLYRKK